ncbi:cytochrome C [Aliiroseovarius sp. S1339]|uniref:cytochrome c3 family protein n=1 Tax=Aliiroseovarius sp. S1339 TaxID=2936990 RepID=UPI0020BDD5A6|nr:cytochrome c3 family protein [Aliiroseovarius sp. S1339]MCK8462485.1 cytochrome C [Aliiroseovarius sp. S1339]
MMQHPAKIVLQVFGFAALLAFGMNLGPSGSFAQEEKQEEKEAAESIAEPMFNMPKSGPFAPETISIPNAKAIAAWSRSGHADAASESFSHWNEEGEIPANCATCHSGVGFRSFHGLDGSPKGLPEDPFPIGGVVDCETCHNPGLSRITEIALPSGVVHPVSGGDVSCMTCHQGRASGARVTEATAGIAEDTSSGELRFVNPHYNIAAATTLGGYARLGYQYPDKTYSGRFNHAKPVATCVSCHKPHDLTVAEANCLTCHQSGDAKAIRIARQSYDGSGKTDKGIYHDINANADLLMSLIQDYATEIAGKAMIYDGTRYPYFFADANADGLADEADGRSVSYDAFTPRLLKAVYNWKFITADPGIHVHNPHYALELAYDSVEDLSAALGRDFAEFGLLR